MNTKEKYKEIIKEVVRNEAVSKDKLVKLAEKFGANKLKIQFYLRKAGVIEGLGNGVNRVLIRDQEIAPYVDKVLELTKGGYEKKTEKGLPGNWKNTKEDDDPNTHARAKKPSHPNLQIIAEEEIDLYAKIMDMIEGLDTRISKKTISLEERIVKLESFVNDIDHTELIEDPVTTLRHRIDELENRMNMCGEDIQGLDDKIDSQVELLEDKLEKRIAGLKHVQPTLTRDLSNELCTCKTNGGFLKALHQLFGEIIKHGKE